MPAASDSGHSEVIDDTILLLASTPHKHVTRTTKIHYYFKNDSYDSTPDLML